MEKSARRETSSWYDSAPITSGHASAKPSSVISETLGSCGVRAYPNATGSATVSATKEWSSRSAST
ncbi:MAG TPA: hypothetical protein VNQ80_01145 [Parapedobacter sp.]|uniref:hypothetical protein n=1 Tax=Parapedobacter sp. TaxID=1958893 RepID=UPI002CD1DE42|nr:hypothetical protein [Parapedobacter sp.]HWK55908.1 hypothetical protein [Parapedobacter sp.]